MAFNFFGTFTKAQWFDFKDFVTVQRSELEARRKWVDAQLSRTGQVSCVYDDDNMIPISFDAPPKSYIGKLLTAYRMLGGVPETDMLLRTRKQVVFLKRGVDENDSPDYSNGRVDRGTQRFDRTLGLSIEAMKKWQLEAVKAKREQLEFKIKRAMDYADQLQQESVMLTGLVDGFAVDDQIMEVETTITQPDRYNTPSDVGDRFGLAIGKIGDATDLRAEVNAATGKQRVPQGSSR